MTPVRTILHCTVLALLVFATTPAATAVEPAAQAEKPVREISPELRRVLDGLDGANEDLEGVQADIAYTREIPLLDESENADGTLAFRKPDLIHLKLGKPRNEEVYSDGKQWWVISHEDRQVEIYPAAGRGGSVAEASFLTFGYGQSSETLLEDYRVSLRHTEQAEDEEGTYRLWRLRFAPREGDAPARFSTIEVEITDRLWLPRKMVLHESDGEIVHTFALRGIELNPELKKKRFHCTPPRGYTVIRPE